MSYFRRPLGDGPITSPSETENGPVTHPDFDPTAPGVIISDVAPARKSCEELDPDSPWKKPGQVCDPNAGIAKQILDWLASLRPVPAGQPAPPQPSSTAPVLVLLVAAGAGYYMWTKRKAQR